MRLELTTDQRELQTTLRAYFTRLVTEAVPDGSRPDYLATIRRMGEDGWLGLGWPVEYGGQGRGPVDQMLLVEESHWAGVPLPLLTLSSVGPALMQLGTPEQKARILPGILRGELHFAIGYTEPSAGTDLASLQTRAERDGDEWVITGEKLYTRRDPVRRLRMVGGAHRPRCGQTPGTVGLPGADRCARLQLESTAHHGRRVHERHLL